MAVLTLKGLSDKAAWAKAGIDLPQFDVLAMKAATKNNPTWVHVGPGNIFRGYVAGLAQDLIEKGKMQSGITALSTFDQQVIEKIYVPYDDLALRVIMHSDGKLDKTVIASVGECVKADESEWTRAKEIFINPELQMVSFTITEKGYHIKGMDGNFLPAVLEDFRFESGVPKNGMAVITALLLERFNNGAHPIAMVSMDNFSHNGDKLRDSITTIADKWVENGKASSAFAKWISDSSKVSFPWSMIDKITPRPDPTVSKMLLESGFESTELVITNYNTYIAPFVNAEAAEYLVVEDDFPNGRPPLEEAGVYFTPRETVDRVERMKVCTCLNPLHTAMAIFGCLLNQKTIAEQMKDDCIVNLVNRIGRKEGMPVVTNPGILDPESFLNEVIEKRLPNAYIPDTPERIATDTSQKLAIRFGETIKLYRESASLDTKDLVAIPLSIAAWCRYLMGMDDSLNQLTISPDPLSEQLHEYIAKIKIGDSATIGDNLKPILSNKHIFGLDLYEDDLGEKIEGYFARMIAGKGAVRKVLKEEIL